VNHLRLAERNREIREPQQVTPGGNQKTNHFPANRFDYPAATLGSQSTGCSVFEFGELAVG